MSRYTHNFTPHGEEKVYIVSYGYDRPLSYYFLMVEDPTVEIDEESFDDPSIVFSVGSHITLKEHPLYPGKTRYSNGEIATLMTFWGCPQEHVNKVVFDLPF